MPNISNLYAASIFSEHPTALWNLDDENYFISLLSGSNHFLQNWEIVNNNGQWNTSHSTPITHPFPERASVSLLKNSSASITFTEVNASPIYLEELDLSKNSICFSTWVQDYGSFVDSYEIGFKYTSGSVDTTDSFSISSLGKEEWQQIHKTSLLPQTFDYITPYIKVNYLEEIGNPEEFEVLFSGMSVGQESEEYLYNGFPGIRDSRIIEIDSVQIRSAFPYNANYKGYILDSYSSEVGVEDEDNGYVIINENKLLAKNTKFPMIYGSDNVTSIESPITENIPSLVFPGKGFLNKNGQYKNITFEFWARVSPKENIEQRIFGPLYSEDGLYIDKEYLKLRVGNNTKSYFIGKWYRPMLIDIRYTPTLISCLINGDVVIELNIDLINLNFPLNELDWVGFFTSDNLQTYEVDCVAIYPYLVPDQMIKKRFVYGQGIESLEIVSDGLRGESYNIDFPFINYTATINYPDMNSWNLGNFVNLDSNNKYLSFKNPYMPEIKLTGTPSTNTFNTLNQWEDIDDLTTNWYKTSLNNDSWSLVLEDVRQKVTDIYSDNLYAQSGSTSFFSLKPNDGYENMNGSIEFETLNVLPDKVRSIYATFKTAEENLPSSPETLMYFYNSINNDYFEIQIDSLGLKYKYNDILLREFVLQPNTLFIVGIDLLKLDSAYLSILNNFFSNPDSLSLSLMGRENSTFSGKMYQFTINNDFYTNKDLSLLFDTDGIALQTEESNSIVYVGNYTLKPLRELSSYSLDIGMSGYWEDSIPLSYFGKQIINKSGGSYYDVDLIQINIESPSSNIINPGNALTYSSDNIKVYITLQHFSEVGKVPYSRYTQTEQILNTRVIDFDNTLDVLETKFEVIDGTVILPPKELIDFKDYYITIHVELKTNSVNSQNPQIKKMFLSSIVSDDVSFTSFNSRTGNKIFPVTRYGNSYSYKDKNPFLVYTDSTPGMYLTGDSGITVLPYQSNFEGQGERGFFIPINKEKGPEYSLGGIQLWLMYNASDSIYAIRKVARISTPNKKYDVYIEPIDNGKRGIIKIYNSDTGFISDSINESINNVLYYQDGQIIKNPIINPLKWTSISIIFGEKILLNSLSGSLELYENFLYNNIVIYQKEDNLNYIVGSRSWQDTKQSEILLDTGSTLIENSWSSWSEITWEDLYAPIESFKFALDGELLFKSYTGTAGIVSVDESSVMIDIDKVSVISDVVWDTTLVKPV